MICEACLQEIPLDRDPITRKFNSVARYIVYRGHDFIVFRCPHCGVAIEANRGARRVIEERNRDEMLKKIMRELRKKDSAAADRPYQDQEDAAKFMEELQRQLGWK